MDKALVIGGSGFLGSHVADELSNRGYKVTIFDQTESPWIRKGQEMVVGDVLDRSKLSEATKGVRFLYHFGGVADIKDAREKPFDTIENKRREHNRIWNG